MTQFIGVYENAFSKEFCERAIKYFETAHSQKKVFNRQQMEKASKLHKDDNAYYCHFEENIQSVEPISTEFNEIFWGIYKQQYAQQFAVLEDSGSHNNYASKIQKTLVGGGYHIWHYESMNRASCHRLLVWTVYLNDVEEGGETEFLYQRLRIKAKAGTLAIWPASFTHTHRGNPPLSNDKYIITGWTEF